MGLNLNKIIENVPESLTNLENSLTELKNCQSEEEVWGITKKIDNYLRDVSLRLSLFLAYGGKLVNGIYDKTLSLIQKSHEVFSKSPNYDIFINAAKIRIDYLTEAIKKCQPDLIKDN